MVSCPTCDRDGFNGEAGVRIHHAKSHDKSLPNRECVDCGEMFYDERSDRDYCASCAERRKGVLPKPDDVELPKEESWKELTSYQRYYYKNRADEQERNQKRHNNIREWFKYDFKPEFECAECGEDHPACVDFHHPNGQKKRSVSQMVGDRLSRDRIREEVERCVPMCANCHRKLHYE